MENLADLNKREVFKEGVELLRSIATRMNKMTGKGVNPNTSSDLSSLNEAQPQTEVRGSDLQVNSRLINKTNVETLVGVKFTSLSDIDDFSMSIKEGKYADILSTMSSADIDAAVNVSTSSPLVSPSTTINVPHELNSIDVAATFGVPLTTVGDLHKLINDIEAGKHEELLYGMTNDDRMKTLDALGFICNSIQANHNNAYVIPFKVSHADIYDNPSVMASPNSYAGAAGASVKEQPNVISNFRPLVADPVYDGVNISIPRKVIEKIKLHDVPLQVFEEDGINLIATFIGKPIMLDSYTSSMCKDSWETIRVDYEWRPPKCDECKIFGHVHDHCLTMVVSPHVVTTSNVVAPTVEKTNDGFQTVGKKNKRKGKSKSTNGGQFTGHSVKQIVGCEPKTTSSSPNKGTTNVSNPSTSSSMLKTVENFPKKR
ncbi:hypothetical protein Tco_1279606 [Tanacetum coccineum]